MVPTEGDGCFRKSKSKSNWKKCLPFLSLFFFSFFVIWREPNLLPQQSFCVGHPNATEPVNIPWPCSSSTGDSSIVQEAVSSNVRKTHPEVTTHLSNITPCLWDSTKHKGIVLSEHCQWYCRRYCRAIPPQVEAGRFHKALNKKKGYKNFPSAVGHYASNRNVLCLFIVPLTSFRKDESH